MKITRIRSHVPQCDCRRNRGPFAAIPRALHRPPGGGSTDEGVVGRGECFGPGLIAIADKGIAEGVVAPMAPGMDPLDRDAIWHEVRNLMCDHGRKGRPKRALSGIDIAPWDIAGKVMGKPSHRLVGGAHRAKLRTHGDGMMPERKSVENHIARFEDEAAAILGMGLAAAKMKIGLGASADMRLCETVARGVRGTGRFMVDANHCHTTSDAFRRTRAGGNGRLSVRGTRRPGRPRRIS